MQIAKEKLWTSRTQKNRIK